MEVISTNIMSMKAQMNLNKSHSALGTAVERLSSGLRINSAKDDAAGLAISNRFTKLINGLSQCALNANDGISIAQTTEGALNEINDNLQSIRTLTLQARNGTNSESDKKSIQAEISQRLAEIQRISDQTEFNGTKVLKQDRALNIQIGTNDNEVIEVKLQQMGIEMLGMDKFDVTKDVLTSTIATAGMSLKKGNETAQLNEEQLNKMQKELLGNDAKTGQIYVYEKNNDTIFVGKNEAGVYKSINLASIKPGNNGAAATITLDNAIAAADEYKQDNNLLAKIDSALIKIDNQRSFLGAVQNRFITATNNINSASINQTESRSRLRDADFAAEVSNMSRSNILQSAGTAVLSQANQVTQNVLSLLR